jgi:hypothetical protein
VKEDADFLEVLRWTMVATNSFFSMLYRGGIWLSVDTAKVVVANGYKAIAPC